MPTTVQAAVAHLGALELSVEPLALRDPGPRDVVVQIDATAFCYSDWLAVRGDTGLPELGLHPVVLGHSAVGTVVEAGAAARHEVGRRVLVTATPECGECFWCLSGRIDQCEGLFVPAPVIGTLDDGREVRAPGSAATYAELSVIRDIQVFPVESGLPDAWLAMVGCGIISGMGAVVNVARIEPGSSVVVVGCGQEGLWMVQAAVARGARRVVAVEPLAARRALALRLGATDAVDPGAFDTDAEVRAAVLELLDGRGADYGFDAGGSVSSVQQAFAFTRLGGVVTLTSYVRRDTTVALPLFDLALRGRDVRSSQSGRLDMRRDLAQLLPWLESGLVDAEAMLGGVRPLAEANAALAASRDRTELTPVLLP
ncbi:zinc-binding dehydrogenase [Herbiconiux liukaitaii]|uniref:zinc-binding dehydrogenase n=1 Tax=Herbiconiux liukaitaii TaxID=3342799 RepID=UPI0035BABF9F